MIRGNLVLGLLFFLFYQNRLKAPLFALHIVFLHFKPFGARYILIQDILKRAESRGLNVLQALLIDGSFIVTRIGVDLVVAAITIDIAIY